MKNRRNLRKIILGVAKMSLAAVLQYEHLVAGLLGGFVSTLVVHPLDFMKIRFAVNEGDPKLRPQYKSYWNLTKEILASRGVRGLYQGAVPNLVGATLAWGLYFQFYNILKSWMRNSEHETLSAKKHLAAGFIAGVFLGTATLALTNPVWVVKTRLCLQYESKLKLYSGFIDALVKTFQMEGLRGWYKGFVPGILGTSHGALQFMAYEELKKEYCSYRKRRATEKLGSVEYVTFAALSKLFAATCTYPYQVVRARLQDQHVSYNGVGDVVVKTWKGEGLGGFYKGLLPSLIRVTPATCVTFLVYEHVSHFLLQRRNYSTLS